MVQVRIACLGGIGHFSLHAVSTQKTGITNLSAGLGIERRLIQHSHTLLAFVQRLDLLAITEQRNHTTLPFSAIVALEAGLDVDLDQRVVIQTKLAGRPGALALRFHRCFKAGFINGQLTLTGNVTGQINREAVSVIEFENNIAGNLAALQLGQILLQNAQALIQRLGKLLFLGFQHALDVRLLGFQLGERIAHLGCQRSNDLVEKHALGAQLVAVAASAANDAAQHVAPTFIGRQHAVSNQEAAGTNMVSDHFQRRCVVLGTADGFGGGGQQVLEQVDLVVGMHVLHDGADALQAHAGVYTRRRQRVHFTISRAIELHEDVVPDFDIAITVLFGRARRATPYIGAVIKENLGTGAARAGVAHGPEVVGGVRRTLVIPDTHHALGGHTHFFGPDVVRLVIAGVDGDPELLLGQVQPFVRGQKLPRIVDGITLEVVAKAEVAQHLEEGVMARGVPDVLQVIVLAAGAHALLAAGGAGIGALFQAQEAVLELVHAGVGEQQCRVVGRNQRAGGNAGVPLFFKETEEGFTDVCAFHNSLTRDGSAS